MANFVESVDMKCFPNQKIDVIDQFRNGSRPVTQIELITPNQQAVEIDKSLLMKRKNDGEPIVHFKASLEKKQKAPAIRRREIHLFTPEKNYYFVQ